MKKQTINTSEDYQLNGSVATNVMGVKELFYPGIKKQIPYYLPKGSVWNNAVLNSKPLPKYSSEIKAAWSVLEKLISYGMRVHVENSSTDNENTNNEIAWCVTVTDKSINSTVCSESLPEAICRVALEALDKRSKA